MSRNNHHSLKLPTSFSSSLRCSPIHRESRASSERGLMALIPTRSTVSNSMHKSQRQTEQIRAFKCKLGQSCSSVPSSYATPETSPVEKQTGCCPLPSFTDTHMHQHGSTHLFYLSRSWSVQIQCVCRQSEELLLPPHRREQTAHCYRCTDKWKEGGVVSHEINKRGRQRRRSEAPSIYNSILPSLHFSAMFLPPARSFLFLSSYLLLFYRQFFSSFPALLFLTLSVVFSPSLPVLLLIYSAPNCHTSSLPSSLVSHSWCSARGREERQWKRAARPSVGACELHLFTVS